MLAYLFRGTMGYSVSRIPTRQMQRAGLFRVMLRYCNLIAIG